MTLEQLGPRGEQCVSRKLARGRSRFYEFQYRPGTADAEGRISHYTIQARPYSYQYGKRRLFSDESGVIRWALEDRDATAKDPTLP